MTKRYLLWGCLTLVILCQPALAEDSSTVVKREKQRLELLLDWRPGQQSPRLPQRLKFEPPPRPSVFLEAIDKPQKALSGRRRVSSSEVNLPALEAWIRSYNGAVKPSQARLFAHTIIRQSQRLSLDPRLVTALVAAESAFQPRVVSPAGARGLGQLMPGTAAMLGVTDAFDPRQNLAGTVTYLERQLRRFGSPRLALAAYNAGPGAVQKYGGVPPYRETQAYVRYVLKLYQELKNDKSVTLAAEGVNR